MSPGGGIDKVLDFSPGDVLDFSLLGIRSFARVKGAASDVGDDMKIDFETTHGTAIIIRNFSVNLFDANDVTF